MTADVNPAEHLGLVHRIAQRVPRGYSLDYADAVGIGSVALVECSKRYRDTYGVPFHLYAARRIRGAIQDEVRKLAKQSNRAGSVHSLDVLEEAYAVPDATIDPSTWGDAADLRWAVAQLRPRERHIARLLAQGLTYKQVAQDLGISASRTGKLIERMRKRVRALDNGAGSGNYAGPVPATR